MPADERPAPRRPDGGRGRPGGTGGGRGKPPARDGGGRGGPRRDDDRPRSGSGARRSGSGRDDQRSGGRRPGEGSGDERGSAGERFSAGPKAWGSLGRRGAGRVREGEIDRRDAVGASGRDDRPDPGNEQVRWERVDDVRREASGAVSRGRGAPPRTAAADDLAPKERRGRPARNAGSGTGGAVAKDELVSALGATRGARANERLRDAAHAFERERFAESRTLLKPIAEAAPQAAAVRELLGLTYYRLGRWNDAVRELEAFRELARSTEQHPVLADAYRALRRHRDVEALWEELKESSPAADLVTEGRIVMAGSLADRDKLPEAVALLEKSQRSVKRPGVHHLRQAYALADLYERAGDAARARELFRWVVDHEPAFADAPERLAGLT